MRVQPPDLLTIEEAARILRIGRTKAYAMSQEWRATNGVSGIKVCELGGQLRVPKAWIEDQLGAPVLFVPSAPDRPKRNGHPPEPDVSESEPQPLAETTPLAQPIKSQRRTKRAPSNSNQLTLPFS